MKQSALEQYTKDKKLYGQNEQEILDKFVLYASYCSDPINIYKYMEQKSICIYLANYWTCRAHVFAEMGDFRDAFLCLKQANSRNHIVSESEVKIQEHWEKIKKKIITAMKRFLPKGKRTANQYNLMYENQNRVTEQNLENLVDVFEKNYKSAKKQIQKQFQLKMHGKIKSWLASIEEQKEQNMRKISQKMKSTTNLDFMSMRTPITKKDPMRLTKTMDSVEMLKKKKSTQPKEKKQKLGQNNQLQENQNNRKQLNNCESDNEFEEEDEEMICVNTTPVGRQLSILSRRVTFDTKKQAKYDKIEKIRSNADDNSNNSNIASQKRKGDGSVEKDKSIDKSKSFSKRGSILKNKKAGLSELNMEDQK